MGLLDDTAGLFGELFTPLYHAATLSTNATTYTTQGDIRRGPDPHPCLVQVDSATEAMRNAEGYTATDRGIYILASSVDGVDVNSDCSIAVAAGPHAGATFALGLPIERDPGAAYVLARGTQHG